MWKACRLLRSWRTTRTGTTPPQQQQQQHRVSVPVPGPALRLRLIGDRTSCWRSFHACARRAAVRPFILSDPGEGIKEVQIIQWFVEPGARVEQFDKIVEVQTDKASNEITSRYDGVIRKLHYATDDVVQVGQALLDIDVQNEGDGTGAGGGEHIRGEEGIPEPQLELSGSTTQQQQQLGEATGQSNTQDTTTAAEETPSDHTRRSSQPSGHHSALATPAVRGLLKHLDIDIRNVQGTGRDGRVTKEDVHAYAQARTSTPPASQSQQRITPTETTTLPPPPPPPHPSTISEEPQSETPTPLTPIQAQMYKTMTKSLTIPHFLYADEVDVTALSALRNTLNRKLNSPNTPNEDPNPKLSYLPFILKAVSLALTDFPLINARLEPSTSSPSPSSNTNTPTSPPRLLYRRAHNIGIAMDTPAGLLVPVIRNVQNHSIRSLASQTGHLQSLARSNRLTPRDLSGGTFTVSNIGSLGGGTYVAPVIVPTEVAIVGAGRVRAVPRFADPDASGDGEESQKVVRRLVMPLSWSADHRVVDGATMARMAERVKMLLEEPGLMMVGMR